MYSISVLICSHNRKEKTLSCLKHLCECKIPHDYVINIFLVDDGSTDGTLEAVQLTYPLVEICKGNGSLYWARAMILAWNLAIKKGESFAYLLLNDDVVLNDDCLSKFKETDDYCYFKYGCRGIYVGSTVDLNSGKITYGGHKIIKNHIIIKSGLIQPDINPINFDFANANILWVSNDVVMKIGIFDSKYIHGLADYDYTLTARKNNIPQLVVPGFSGICVNDHGNNWKTPSSSFKERVKYLMSPKGLSYKEYMYFRKKHFIFALPYYFIMIWTKTLLPNIWENKNKN